MDTSTILGSNGANAFVNKMSGVQFGGLVDTLIQIISIVALIFIAFFLAGLIRTVIIKLFTKINIDQKVSQLLGTNIILTDVIGMIGYYMVILFFLPGILQSIGLEQMVNPIQQILDSILSFIPRLLSAGVIGGIFYIIAKIIADIVSKFITGIDLLGLISKIGITSLTVNNTQLSKVIKLLVFTIVLLIGSGQIFNLLGLHEFGVIVNNITQGMGSILLGGLIIAFGLYLATVIADFVGLSGSKASHTLSMICKYGIVIFAVLIGLDKMGVPSNLINLLVMIIFGSLGLGFALAFGLGAKETIGEEVKNFIQHIKK